MPFIKNEKQSKMTQAAFVIMWWMGSVTSLVVHTIVFVVSFVVVIFGAPWETVLLVVTTVVSLEAIYMNILIQMGVNQNTESLQVVEEDLDEIQEDVGEIQKDVDVIQEDVGEIEKDIDEIQVDIDEVGKDVSEDEQRDIGNRVMLSKIESQLQEIGKEIEQLKKNNEK